MTVKRTWLVLFGLLLLLASPAEAQAQFTYMTNADGRTLTITGYAGPPWAVVIPANISGMPVISIGTNAFYDDTSLTSVTIPNGVTNISGYAFYGCSSLTNVTIPNSIASIGDLAFYACSSLTSVAIPSLVTSVQSLTFQDCTNLVSVTIPNGVTTIEEYAFTECYSLAGITIPSSVTSIGNNAFTECYSLASVVIPNSVTSIGADAFYRCTNMTNVTISSSATSIGDSAFQDCGRLSGVYFQGSAPAADATVFTDDNHATAYYLFGTTGWSNSFAGLPAVPLDAPGAIQVTLLPASANGQWRFSWEGAWRNSGSIVSNLVPGADYSVVFSTAPGYLAPTNPGLVAVTSGVTTLLTNCYSPIIASTNVSTMGLLTVNFVPSPPAGAAWGLVGATNLFSFSSGYSASLAPGTYLIGFAPVSHYATPANLSVLVAPGTPTVRQVTYLPAVTTSNLPANFSLPKPVPPGQIAEAPFAFNGQLQTDAGYGSGVAVLPNVVLTAADVVFNDQTLSYASQATWFSQEETNLSVPAPLQARGWYVLSGYASQRTGDLQAGLAPGQSSPGSRNFDVAALFFISSTAGSACTSYLASDAPMNPWLTSTNEKMLVGYPVDGSQFGEPGITNGYMYEILPQTNSLRQATDQPSAAAEVYLADSFLSFPGYNGGALYASSNGAYYPAAIYVGTVYQGLVPIASAVRAIDSDVTHLINDAANAAGNETDSRPSESELKHAPAAASTARKDSPSGGVSEILAGQVTANNPAYVQAQLKPASAVQAGAGWRLQGETSYSFSGTSKSVAASDVVIEFKPINGYSTPSNQSLKLEANQFAYPVGAYSFEQRCSAELRNADAPCQWRGKYQGRGKSHQRRAIDSGGQICRHSLCGERNQLAFCQLEPRHQCWQHDLSIHQPSRFFLLFQQPHFGGQFCDKSLHRPGRLVQRPFPDSRRSDGTNRGQAEAIHRPEGCVHRHGFHQRREPFLKRQLWFDGAGHQSYLARRQRRRPPDGGHDTVEFE